MFSLLIAALATALVVAGCGGSDSTASSGDVAVETSSLSKAEFAVKANAVCEKSADEFTGAYGAFFKSNEPGASPAAQKAWLREVVDEVVLPAYEKEIDQLSTIGAPAAEVEKVESFLNALQARLDAIQQDPLELTKTPTPFKQAGNAAAKGGLVVCGEALGAGA